MQQAHTAFAAAFAESAPARAEGAAPTRAPSAARPGAGRRVGVGAWARCGHAAARAVGRGPPPGLA
eukprot:11168152-Lingulodinium_polyedra.AAC.1